MEDLAYVVRFALHWSLEHPLRVAAVIAGLLGLQWLLNRKTRLERDAERIVRELTRRKRSP
jgi:hypothetical protein